MMPPSGGSRVELIRTLYPTSIVRAHAFRGPRPAHRVCSWLPARSARALGTDEKLVNFTGDVSDNGEGRWTIDAAVEEAVPIPVPAALPVRFRPRQEHTSGENCNACRPEPSTGHETMIDNAPISRFNRTGNAAGGRAPRSLALRPVAGAPTTQPRSAGGSQWNKLT
jgi:hypothetical protein